MSTISNPRLDQLRGEVEYLETELRNIHAGAEERSLDEDEDKRFNDGMWLRSALIAQGIELEERLRQVETFSRHESRREHGDGTRDAGFQVQRPTDDPFEYRSAVQAIDSPHARGTELRGRALKAAEVAPHMTTEQRQAVTLLIESDSAQHDSEGNQLAPEGARSQWILDHGSEEYHEAFREAMRNPIRPNLSRFSERAALSLTGANGGYFMPFTLDPSVILTNDGTQNPFRMISRTVTTTTKEWNGISSAGVTAEWIAEATQVADASPTFAQPNIPVHKADAYVQASIEVIADTAVSGELTGLIQDAKDRLESTAFAVGTGSGQPTGIVTNLNLTTTSRVAGSSGAAGAADLTIADIYAVDNDLGPRYRQNASWVGNHAIGNRIRRLLSDSASPNAFWADFGQGLPPNLIGYPFYQSSAMDSTIVSGSNDEVLILGDFRNYVIVDRMGVEMAYEPLVKGGNGRPTGEVGWVAFWRVGGESVNDAAFRALRL